MLLSLTLLGKTCL